jgi:hypothetical protein
MVNINIKVKDLFLIVAIFIFISATGVIIAYNPSGATNPASLGHSANEVQGSITGSCTVNCDGHGFIDGHSYFFNCIDMWGTGHCNPSNTLGMNCKFTDECLCDTGNTKFVLRHGFSWPENGENVGYTGNAQLFTYQLTFICVKD